jgi:Glyoxalase-like domain
VLELDHVLIAVADLHAAAAEFESVYGLASVEGGRHTGWGTANRIVPLGTTYLELVAVVDGDEAAGSAFGQWVASGQAGHPLGWAVRTDELDEVVRRLDLTVRSGSRPTADGGLLRWRMAGIEQAGAEPFLPFFIEWAPGAAFPGRATVHHAAGASEITQVTVSGDPDRLSLWLGTPPRAIVVRAGPPEVAKVVVSTAAGPLVLSANHG